MKNSLYLSILAVTCLGVGAASAQRPTLLPPVDTNSGMGTPNVLPTTPLTAPAGGPTATAQGMAPSQPGINEYLAYPRPPGAGLGNSGLIGSEAYFRAGYSANLGGTGIFGRVFDGGYAVQGGVRSIFFRPQPTVGWTVDVGLASVWYHAGRSEKANLRNFPSTTTVFGQTVTTIIPSFPVTPTNLNQTSVRLALGQEYYLYGDADPADGDWKWRAGWDAGGILGSSKLNLQEIRHRTGEVYGGLAAIHSDVEMPYGHCILQAGVRLEYDYTTSKILQSQNNTDFSALNLMFTTGFRF